MKMKRIVFARERVVELWDAECPAPGVGQIQVRMAYTAISAGTERANLIGAPIGPRTAVNGFPKYLGYSGSGIVAQVGEDVTDFQPGDRVALRWCSHSEYCTLPKENAALIPDTVSLRDAATAFISTFPLAAVRKARIELGESCMVMGLGILGIFAVSYARMAGAYPVIAVDFDEDRRALALKLGADYALDPRMENFAERVKQLTGGVNAVIEVTGNGAALNQALSCTARFGRVALLGCTRTPTEVDFYHDVHLPGITLIGAHTAARPARESYPCYWTEADDLRTALRLMAAGRLDTHEIIGEVHAPAEAPEVYRRLLEEKKFPLGVLFEWERA